MKRTFFLIMSVLILLLCCGCGTQTAFSGSETAAPAAVSEPDTEPAPVVTVPVTESITEAVTESAAETVPTETEPVTEPTEPQPVKLTFSSYPQGTTNLRSITSDEGITITVDSNHFFEFPEYKGIKFWRTDAALNQHVASVTFGCENGNIDRIEVLGSNKQIKISPDGTPVEPIYGCTVPKEYRLEIGYSYLRIFGTSDKGEDFQILLIKGTR